MSNTINAAANPALANQLLNQALNEAPQETTPEIVSPSDTTVDLPGGYINSAGEVIRTAEVRELNGKDEEAISKTSNLGKALMTILQRGTVKIGSEVADEKTIDALLIGDRDAILLGIVKSTFGPKVEIQSYCSGCKDYKAVQIDIDEDIKIKKLSDPINDRVFTVKGKKLDYVLQLPNGVVQKAMIENMDKSSAELSTIILENTVVRIGESPVISKSQIQALSVVDRRTLVEELNNRAAGPQFDDVTITCPDCESEVLVPINLGTLFQF
jgi:Zn finger protein HypA/HybF involved in hydrogenase expression